MKIIYALNPSTGGMNLVQAECDNTAEAEEFTSWYLKALEQHGTDMPEPVAPIERVEFPTTADVEAKEVLPEVTRDMLSQAVIALVQAKGRPAADVIMAKYGAKRLSGIPDDKVAEAYALVQEAL